jgi:ATP-binding cassette, subfamily C (CFTR/MRP), member 1
MYLLWQMIGAACLAGLVVMMALIPVNTRIAARAKQIASIQAKQKDSRVKLMNQVQVMCCSVLS